MLDEGWAIQFAHDWIESWNFDDLDRVLSYSSEELEVSSPLIVERLGREDGILKGKTAVGQYWSPSMSQEPPLRFELGDILVGVNHLTISYRDVGRRVVADTLTFDNSLEATSVTAQWSVFVTGEVGEIYAVPFRTNF